MKVEQALQKIENQIEDEQYEPLPNWNENLVSSIIESFRTLQFYLKKKQTGVVPSGSKKKNREHRALRGASPPPGTRSRILNFVSILTLF